MLIGTWNLAGRWGPSHQELMLAADCDVWLLTEVNERVEIAGFRCHLGAATMAQRRRWAAILARHPVEPLPDPHPASAAAVVNGLTFCSSILPWRSCGARPPWEGDRHADRTAAALVALRRTLTGRRLVWGGDWNHAMSGSETAGSAAGRRHILDALDALGLTVPTAELPHRINGLLSIDHIAVGKGETVRSAGRIRADGLSDHDAYVVRLGGG